ncbi:MAG: DinB family protein [Pirellulaceae bacterium]
MFTGQADRQDWGCGSGMVRSFHCRYHLQNAIEFRTVFSLLSSCSDREFEAEWLADQPLRPRGTLGTERHHAIQGHSTPFQSSERQYGLAVAGRSARLTPDAAFGTGGNHAMWIAGHLLVSDHGFQAMMTGAEHARPELKPMFAGGSTPTTNADDYPPFARMLEDLQGSNEAILAWLDGMTEDDLDQPSKLVPPGFEPFFGTWRQVFAMRPLHWAMHRGQLADCRLPRAFQDHGLVGAAPSGGASRPRARAPRIRAILSPWVFRSPLDHLAYGTCRRWKPTTGSTNNGPHARLGSGVPWRGWETNREDSIDLHGLGDGRQLGLGPRESPAAIARGQSREVTLQDDDRPAFEAPPDGF